jgi:hypothetical protein
MRLSAEMIFFLQLLIYSLESDSIVIPLFRSVKMLSLTLIIYLFFYF